MQILFSACLTSVLKFAQINLSGFNGLGIFSLDVIFLFTFLYLYLYQTDTIQQLQKRLALLDSQQKSDLEGQISHLSTYGQRNLSGL